MICRNTCGCLYLQHDDNNHVGEPVIFLVMRCDQDGHSRSEWEFSEGLRESYSKSSLEPVTADEAREVFAAWGLLIADGYNARDIRDALKRMTAH